jgi:hypothetical protein
MCVPFFYSFKQKTLDMVPSGCTLKKYTMPHKREPTARADVADRRTKRPVDQHNFRSGNFTSTWFVFYFTRILFYTHLLGHLFIYCYLKTNFCYYFVHMGTHCSVVGWGTMLQAGRLLVRVPDKVDFFNLLNPSSRTMALESNQPLTEISTRYLPGSKTRPGRRANNLADICEPNV